MRLVNHSLLLPWCKNGVPKREIASPAPVQEQISARNEIPSIQALRQLGIQTKKGVGGASSSKKREAFDDPRCARFGLCGHWRISRPIQEEERALLSLRTSEASPPCHNRRTCSSYQRSFARGSSISTARHREASNPRVARSGSQHPTRYPNPLFPCSPNETLKDELLQEGERTIAYFWSRLVLCPAGHLGTHIFGISRKFHRKTPLAWRAAAPGASIHSLRSRD